MNPTDETVYAILSAWSTDGATETAGADYLLIELTPDYAEWLVDRIELFEECRLKLGGLRSMEWTAAGLDFFGWCEEVDGLLESADPYLTDRPFVIPEEELAPTEDYGRLIVDEEGVSWMTWLAGSSVRIYTTSIPSEIIRQVAAREWEPSPVVEA